MENKLTAEQMEKAKGCICVKEIIALAKENGIELTEAEAKSIFAQLNPALSDDELETVVAAGKVALGSKVAVITNGGVYRCESCGHIDFQLNCYQDEYVYLTCIRCKKINKTTYTSIAKNSVLVFA